jgi:hypothetical protein
MSTDMQACGYADDLRLSQTLLAAGTTIHTVQLIYNQPINLQ